MTGTQAPPATSPTDDQLRATRLFLLAAGLFVFLTAEMYPVGAMPDMTRDLGESDAAVGRLVTWYAVGVGVAAIPLVMLTRRMPRRRVIVACLLALFVSMAMAALAPNLLVVTIARFIGAAAHGAIFAVVPVAAASLARRGAEAKSVASAFLGASVGVVAGPPFVAAVSDHLGWRVASGIIAAIALAVGQLLLYAAVAVVGASFTDWGDMLPGLTSGLAWFVIFFIAGFTMIAALYAVSGALASRQEDIQSTSFPVTMLLMVMFFGAMFASGTVVDVLAWIPPFSAILQPMRLVSGEAQWWEAVISLGLLAAATVAVILVAERIYRRALMQTGGKLTYKDAWNAEL